MRQFVAGDHSVGARDGCDTCGAAQSRRHGTVPTRADAADGDCARSSAGSGRRGSAPRGRGGCMFGVPMELLVGLLVTAGVGLLAALYLAERSSSRRAGPRKRHTASPTHGTRAAGIPTPRTPIEVTEPEGPL